MHCGFYNWQSDSIGEEIHEIATPRDKFHIEVAFIDPYKHMAIFCNPCISYLLEFCYCPAIIFQELTPQISGRINRGYTQ